MSSFFFIAVSEFHTDLTTCEGLRDATRRFGVSGEFMAQSYSSALAVSVYHDLYLSLPVSVLSTFSLPCPLFPSCRLSRPLLPLTLLGAPVNIGETQSRSLGVAKIENLGAALPGRTACGRSGYSRRRDTFQPKSFGNWLKSRLTAPRRPQVYEMTMNKSEPNGMYPLGSHSGDKKSTFDYAETHKGHHGTKKAGESNPPPPANQYIQSPTLAIPLTGQWATAQGWGARPFIL